MIDWLLVCWLTLLVTWLVAWLAGGANHCVRDNESVGSVKIKWKWVSPYATTCFYQQKSHVGVSSLCDDRARGL